MGLMKRMADLVDLALAEDIGSGDVTVEYFCDATRLGRARIVARVPCIAAGTATAAEVFRRVDPRLDVTVFANDGVSIAGGDVVMKIVGPIGSILTGERTALNFLQRLSAVATRTRDYVNAVAGTACRILDTRKTTPGMRLLEKSAVLAGGATNHRMGLYDMVMVKDNHLAGGLDVAQLQSGIERLKSKRPEVRVEVEADTLDQVFAFYQVAGIDVILLDNMPVESISQAVRARPPGILLEASGGVDLQSVRAIAETGVDFISIGALTHSAGSIDLSLEIDGDYAIVGA